MPSPVPPEDFPLFPAGFASFLSALPYAPSRIRAAHRSLSPAHLRPSPCRRKTRMPLPARQTPRPPGSSARKPAPPPSPTRHRKKASRPFARHAAYPGNMPFSGLTRLKYVPQTAWHFPFPARTGRTTGDSTGMSGISCVRPTGHVRCFSVVGGPRRRASAIRRVHAFRVYPRPDDA